MAIIEVNVAGFQFTRGVPQARHGWHVRHHLPRLHMRRWSPRVRVA
jgi:hypothetical protein